MENSLSKRDQVLLICSECGTELGYQEVDEERIVFVPACPTCTDKLWENVRSLEDSFEHRLYSVYRSGRK